ncbi:NAD-dependent epimerase/dehydratase family protein [Bacillus rubiinfantis]|uniref:NAD-dependent epimerase/dehydratase family protein n=1 Tax=Bacillus rubiinfantis TaxID=1499680 RepID=UPI0005A8A108|nr:NAD-dependent epimerase/dehydratase family protein [Bacillus rubiinfantis]
MNSRPKLLITGANGFIGLHACRHFQHAGYEVIATTRGSSAFKGEASQSNVCNLVNKKEVLQLIKKVKPDYILHLAAQNHVGDSWTNPVLTIETNVLSTLYLIEAIRMVKPDSKIIVVGSMLQVAPENYTQIPHPYSLSKTLQILVAQAWETLYNMNIIIVKPSNLIGPGFSNGVCSLFAKQIAAMEQGCREQVLQVNNLQAQRDFLDVRDAVTGFRFAFEKGIPGHSYNLKSGKLYSLEKITQLLQTFSTVSFEVIDNLQVIDEQIPPANDDLIVPEWRPVISIEKSIEDILRFYRGLECNTQLD